MHRKILSFLFSILFSLFSFLSSPHTDGGRWRPMAADGGRWRPMAAPQLKTPSDRRGFLTLTLFYNNCQIDRQLNWIK